MKKMSSQAGDKAMVKAQPRLARARAPLDRDFRLVEAGPLTQNITEDATDHSIDQGLGQEDEEYRPNPVSIQPDEAKRNGLPLPRVFNRSEIRIVVLTRLSPNQLSPQSADADWRHEPSNPWVTRTNLRR